MKSPASSESRRATPVSVGFTLSQLGFATSGGFAELVGVVGLEPRHFALLRAISEAEGSSQQAVAESLRIPASTMVALVDHLEAEKMLERRAHPSDRRTRTLHLTARGAAVLAEAVQLAWDYERRICAGLAAPERERLLSLLGRVAMNMGVDLGSLPDHGTGRRPDPLSPA